MPSSPTSRGTRRLSEVTKHLTIPNGIKTSGWPQVEKRCRQMGVGFDEWQRGAGRLALAKTSDGKYAATVGGVGWSFARQVGKTYTIGGISFALSVDNPGLTVIWTSHHSRTTDETFLAMRAMTTRHKIAPYLHPSQPVRSANGQQQVRFANGSRILFGAREHGFGRGMAGVDVLVCDEAQILSEKALDAMLATMNTSPNALPLFVGTPPTPTDPSEAFRRMRTDALEGELTDGVWVECGADDECDPDDREQWEKANPSYPHRTPLTSMLRLRKKLAPDSWLREGLGVWDRDGGILPGWGDLFVDEDPPPLKAIGLSVSMDSSFGSIASADLWDDGRVNLSAVDRRGGTAWLVGEAKRIQTKYRCEVVVDEKCPDGTLIEALEAAGVRVRVMKLADYVAACSEMKNRVRDKTLTHQKTTELDEHVEAAQWREVGDGRTVFGRKKSSGPIDMLEAAAAALWGALNPVRAGIYSGR